jgi:hypothetical protein
VKLLRLRVASRPSSIRVPSRYDQAIVAAPPVEQVVATAALDAMVARLPARGQTGREAAHRARRFEMIADRS